MKLNILKTIVYLKAAEWDPFVKPTGLLVYFCYSGDIILKFDHSNENYLSVLL